MKNKYYAVITPNSLGIFSSWALASENALGVKNSLHKSFNSYGEAKSYILDHISKVDYFDFCLDRCELYLNKCFIRKRAYIDKKETRLK